MKSGETTLAGWLAPFLQRPWPCAAVSSWSIVSAQRQWLAWATRLHSSEHMRQRKGYICIVCGSTIPLAQLDPGSSHRGGHRLHQWM
jgi:hypothetical protein